MPFLDPLQTRSASPCHRELASFHLYLFIRTRLRNLSNSMKAEALVLSARAGRAPPIPPDANGCDELTRTVDFRASLAAPTFHKSVSVRTGVRSRKRCKSRTCYFLVSHKRGDYTINYDLNFQVRGNAHSSMSARRPTDRMLTDCVVIVVAGVRDIFLRNVVWVAIPPSPAQFAGQEDRA